MDPSGRCYACFRPQESCFCESIPRIANRTEVVILQHRRESSHRFNTARIVHRALDRSQLLIGHAPDFAAGLGRLGSKAAVLYPAPSARLISELSEDELPEQLVILDGTWHHAKTMMRDLPMLRALPQLRLDPVEPSRYRIRREPNEISLSTVEATVAALRMLEPETAGWEQLLAAFETMIEDQLAHPRAQGGARFAQQGTRAVPHVPLQLLGSLENIVVAYGEAPAGERGSKKTSEAPIAWIAQRLGDGATFAQTLVPPRPLEDDFLEHLQLTHADFASALTLADAQQRWQAFLRPHDELVVFQPGTARQLSFLSGSPTSCLVLKSIPWGALEESLGEDRLRSASDEPDVFYFGRAGKRLAETIDLVRRLNALAGGGHESHIRAETSGGVINPSGVTAPEAGT